MTPKIEQLLKNGRLLQQAKVDREDRSRQAKKARTLRREAAIGRSARDWEHFFASKEGRLFLCLLSTYNLVVVCARTPSALTLLCGHGFEFTGGRNSWCAQTHPYEAMTSIAEELSALGEKGVPKLLLGFRKYVVSTVQHICELRKNVDEMLFLHFKAYRGKWSFDERDS